MAARHDVGGPEWPDRDIRVAKIPELATMRTVSASIAGVPDLSLKSSARERPALSSRKTCADRMSRGEREVREVKFPRDDTEHVRDRTVPPGKLVSLERLAHARHGAGDTDRMPDLIRDRQKRARRAPDHS
jgi:hypothetical protein